MNANSSYLLTVVCSLLLAAAVVSPSTARSAQLTHVDVSGANHGGVRVQAVDDGVMRIWFKADGNFQRKPSNSLLHPGVDGAPLDGMPAGDSTVVKTRKLRVTVSRTDLGFSVTSTDGGSSLIDDGEIAWNKGPNDAGGWALTYRLRPDEHLLGLGQDNRNGGRLDRRGAVRDLWTGQQINYGNVTANYPVPLLISVDSRGRSYGLFVDDVHRLHFDLGAADKNVFRCDADGGEADFYVIEGPTPADVVERYTALTGRPPLPALWTLGYIQSKCVFWNWQDLDKASAELTKRGFPFDALVIDYDWPDKLNDYTWDKRWYGDGYTPTSKIADYARRGVKIVLSNSGPMIVKDSPTYPSGWQDGVFATDGHGNPVEAGYYHGELLDFTSPAIDQWLQPQVEPLIRQGVAGWWLDLSEPEGDSPQT